MRIGISLNSAHVADGPKNMIERANAAHRAGLASLSVGDHHAMATNYAQNTPITGRLLAEWPDRPAGCLFLLPLWHPLLVAEHVGTLAAVHGDRFIVQTGIGRGADQFAAFGLTERDRAARIEESIPVITRLLAGETVDSEVFDMVGGKVGLRPDGPVEWWIGAGADVGLERAARLGDVWYGGPSLDVASAKEHLDRYRSFGGERAIVRKDAIVLADGDLARATADEILANGYRGLGREQLIIGNADDAAEQLSPYFELGFEEVVVRCMTVPQDLAIETIETLGSLTG